MRILIPVRLTQDKPKRSGEYLTDIGKIWYNVENHSFTYGKDERPLPSHAVHTWFEEKELKDLLRYEYERGYADGVGSTICSHSVEQVV